MTPESRDQGEARNRKSEFLIIVLSNAYKGEGVQMSSDFFLRIVSAVCSTKVRRLSLGFSWSAGILRPIKIFEMNIRGLADQG